VRTRPAPPAPVIDNPYCGPRPFTRAEGVRFFGREREASDLFSLLSAHRAVLLYAQSGAGKTSLLNAKLIPALEEAGFDVLPTARVTGAAPAAGSPAPANVYVFNCATSWSSGAPALDVTLAGALSARPLQLDGAGEPRPRVLVLDQFEELFTTAPTRWSQRRGFFEQLDEAMAADARLRVLFAMREDFLAHVDPYEDLVVEDLRTRYRLEKLRRASALVAIKNPLAGTGVSFAPSDDGRDDAADALVDNLLRVPGAGGNGTATPTSDLREYVEGVQLQVVCFKLFRSLSARPHVITAAEIATLGDIDRALGEFYEEALDEAAAKAGLDEDRLRRWFDTQLITKSGTRGLVLRGPDETGGIPNAAVDALDALHIIRPEIRDQDAWYELSHDRFIVPIQRANDEWRARERHAEQQALLKASREELRRKWLARGAAILAVLFAAITVLSVVAVRQRNRARRTADELSVTAEQLRVKAEELRKANADLNSRVNVLQSRLGIEPGPDTTVTGRPPGSAARTPPELARLYHFPPLDGAGQTVAMIELGGGPRLADLQAYFRELKIDQPEVASILVDGAQNVEDATTDQATILVEIVGALAPKARIVSYLAPNTEKGFVDALLKVVKDARDLTPAKRPTILLMNWGSPEIYWTPNALTAFNQALQAAATVGITVIATSGTGGPSDGVNDGALHVDFPASSPYVLGCGITSLEATGDRVEREVAWRGKGMGKGVGTGGGFSKRFDRPSWQNDLPSSAPGQQRGRGVPDVAAAADPSSGYFVLLGGHKTEVAGSPAALWAGLIALINQGVGKNVGYINPLLYQGIGATKAFNPVPRGGKAGAGVPGWNAQTGWGSPNGVELLAALKAALAPPAAPK
jgi:hypothetical protein